METDPRLVGQSGDPLGPQHLWKGTQHAWQTPGRHDRHTVHHDLAPGDLSAMDGHDRHHHHHHVWVSQDESGLVGLKVHYAQRGSERIAAMPQPP